MVERFVREFVDTPVGLVPQVETCLNCADNIGRVGARMGFSRELYQVSPGLYCVGIPDEDSPVCVTANYKLSFDTLRADLVDENVWILVLDTRGVNVWCASAYKTFGTDELVRRVQSSRLAELVSHRKLVLPQLGASGVSAAQVKKGCGFEVVWGPIRSADLKNFIASGNVATEEMRKLTFFFPERIILSPVELTLSLKPALITFAVIFVLSGIGPEVFSVSAALTRVLPAGVALLAGLLSGAVLVPAVLSWLPFRSFYLKGVLAAVLPAYLIYAGSRSASDIEVGALIALCIAVSSFAAMNYTGATPYASPSGVEKEMRYAIPFQVFLMFGAAVLWLASPFL